MDNDRDAKLSLRVTEGERAFLIADAAERNQTISEYIRTMLKRRMIEKVRGI